MRITKKSGSKKKLIIMIVVLAVIAASATGYLLYKQNLQSSTRNTEINTEPPTEEQIQAGEDAKNDTITDNEDTPSDSNDTNQPQPSNQLAVTITSANQNGSIVNVRSLIDKLVTGSCALTLKNGNKTIEKQAAIQPLASSATCAGFDVSGLSTGVWGIELAVTATNGDTGLATGSVTVK